jgi:N utilization substance protein B
MGVRRKGREYALQALYLTDVAKVEINKAIRSVTADEKADLDASVFAKRLALGAFEKKEQLDEVIVKHTQNWEIGRMAGLDRNILRLGAYELIYELETPVSVIIDEAVEIAKMFSTDDSGKFVNGILDKIKRERPIIAPHENKERA